MFPQVIKTEAQYREYLEEIERLAGEDPDADSENGERLSLLALLLESYEKERSKLILPKAVDAILFRMEEQCLQQKDLVPFIGSKSRVSEVLSEKRSLTLNMVRALSNGLDIPARVLLVEGSEQEQLEKDMDWKRFPIREMANRGWLGALDNPKQDDLVQAIKVFFDKVGGKGVGPVYCRRTMHLGGEVASDFYAINAWLARVIVRSRELRSGMGSFTRPDNVKGFLTSVAQLSWSEQGPLLAREFLGKSGIVLVIEPHLPKTRLDGAALLDNDGIPIIGLSLRYDRLDNFWFTLLHELAHVLLHLDNKQEVFLDNTELDPDGERKEIEANKYAQEALIPRSIWNRSNAFRNQTTEAIKDLAEELRIHPAIIAGRIRKETGNYRRFSRLVGHKQVRKQLAEREQF